MRIHRPGSRRATLIRTLSVLTLTLGLALAGCSEARAAEADRIAEVLELAPGMVVADVGAGDGEWSEGIARRVAPGGKVYATEVDEEELEKIQERMEEAGLDTVTVVRGDQEDTGLPPGCCDAALLRMVYHHFADPPRMRASLRRALRSGGRVAVIDILPQEHWRKLPYVPERGGHGIRPEDLTAEMAADGFEVVARYDEWNGDPERYCILFRATPLRPAPAGPGAGR